MMLPPALRPAVTRSRVPGQIRGASFRETCSECGGALGARRFVQTDDEPFEPSGWDALARCGSCGAVHSQRMIVFGEAVREVDA